MAHPIWSEDEVVQEQERPNTEIDTNAKQNEQNQQTNQFKSESESEEEVELKPRRQKEVWELTSSEEEESVVEEVSSVSADE